MRIIRFTIWWNRIHVLKAMEVHAILVFDKSIRILLCLVWKNIILSDFNIEEENNVTKDFLEEHRFYNMMKHMHRFTKWRQISLKLVSVILKTNSEKFERKKSLYSNFEQYNLNWIFLIVCLLCLLWEPKQPWKIILSQFYINILLRKQKFYDGIKTHFDKNLQKRNNDQIISQKQGK